MFKGHNESLHYKMYKSGKSWVFAGIVSVGLLVGFGGVTASADTAPTTSDDPAGQVMAEKQPTPADGSVTDTSKADASLPGAANSDDVAPDDQQPDTTPTAADTTPDTVPDDPTSPAPTDDPQNQDPVDNDGHTAEPTAPVTPTRHPGRLAKMAAPTPQNPATPAPTTPAPVATPAAVPEAAPVTASDASIDTWMPNKSLQDLVASQLKKTPATLTKNDLLKLTKLEIGWGQASTHIDGTSSYSLEGLQYATNLTYLDLGYNLMNRQFNKYTNGDITDISRLAALTKLTYLDLSANRISSVSALANLKNLKTLIISGNAIADFSALDYKQYSKMEFGTQDIVLTDPVTIDPSNPTVTIPQIFKLPQNYNVKLQYDVATDYTKTIKDLYVWQDPMSGNGATRRFIRGGIIKTDDQGNHVANPDGSVTFIDIPKQISPANVLSDRPNISIIQNPVTYYLIEDIVSGYEVQVNIFIPYDNPKTAGDLTVKYLNIDGTTIQADQVITGKLTSDTYDLTAETTSLTGYTYDHVDGGDLTGAYTTEPQTISLYFTKDATKPVTPVTPPVVTPTTTVTVTTHYVDQNGQSLHADQIQTGQAGDHYTTAALALPNYTLTATPANASGTLGTADVVVTYVYHQLDDPDQPTTPAPTTDSSDDDATAGTGTGIMVGQQAAQVNPQVADVATLVSHAGQGATIADLTTTTGQPAKVTTTSTTPAGTTSPAPTQSTTKTTLPQTNDQTRSPLIGLALLVGTLIGFGLKRKQH